MSDGIVEMRKAMDKEVLSPPSFWCLKIRAGGQEATRKVPLLDMSPRATSCIWN